MSRRANRGANRTVDARKPRPPPRGRGYLTHVPNMTYGVVCRQTAGQATGWSKKFRIYSRTFWPIMRLVPQRPRLIAQAADRRGEIEIPSGVTLPVGPHATIALRPWRLAGAEFVLSSIALGAGNQPCVAIATKRTDTSAAIARNVVSRVACCARWTIQVPFCAPCWGCCVSRSTPIASGNACPPANRPRSPRRRRSDGHRPSRH